MTSMRLINFGLCFSFIVAVFQVSAQAHGVSNHPGGQALTVRRLFESPKLDGPSPRAQKLLPDGRVLYLKEKTTDFLTLDLWVYDRKKKQHSLLVDSDFLASGGLPEVLSADEKGRRERKRISESGIVEYFVSKNGKALVFALRGGLYFLDLANGGAVPKRLTKEASAGHSSEGASETFLQLSPLGTYLSFVRGSDLFWIECATGKETQVTFDGTALVRYGVPEFIAQEEMVRSEGQFWSPDETVLAFTKTDETEIGVLKRLEVLPSGPEVIEQRYPKAGGTNARVQLGLVKVLAPKDMVWVDSNHGSGSGWEYLARVNWLPGGKILSYQTQDRGQKTLDLNFYALSEKKTQRVLREENSAWINLHSDLHFLQSGTEFVWTSERSGQRQIYLYKRDGTLLRALTASPVLVDRVLEVDEVSGWVYFEGSNGVPEEKHLLRVPLKSGAVEKLTQERGTHHISLASSHGAGNGTGNGTGVTAYIDQFSSLTQPPQVSIRTLGTAAVRPTAQTSSKSDAFEEIDWLEKNQLTPSHPLHPYAAQFVETKIQLLRTQDGRELSALVSKPHGVGRKGSKKVPLIVIVYGGPGSQMVANQWGGKYFYLRQIFAQMGFGVLTVDGRGSHGRGFAFESPIYGQLGLHEVEDQKAAVEALVREGWVDAKRIGVMGWSYGGYMTLMLLLKESSLFKVGVAAAPVTDWLLYDTHYTERYLGHPSSNRKGYSDSNVVNLARNLKGKLLVIHGMADDNVFFNHSLGLFRALQDQMLPFDTMVYPGGKHGIAGKSPQTHLWEKAVEYFKASL